MGLCTVVALVMLLSGNENNFFGFPHTLLGLPGHRRSRLRVVQALIGIFRRPPRA